MDGQIDTQTKVYGPVPARKIGKQPEHGSRNKVSGSGDQFSPFRERSDRNRAIASRRTRTLYSYFQIRTFFRIFRQEPESFQLIPAGNLLKPATGIFNLGKYICVTWISRVAAPFGFENKTNFRNSYDLIQQQPKPTLKIYLNYKYNLYKNFIFGRSEIKVYIRIIITIYIKALSLAISPFRHNSPDLNYNYNLYENFIFGDLAVRTCYLFLSFLCFLF